MSAVVGVWLFGLAFEALVLGGTTRVINGQCIIGWTPNLTVRKLVGLSMTLVDFWLPLVIIAVCYVEIARAVRKVHMHTFGITAPSSGNSQMSRARKNIRDAGNCSAYRD